MDIANVTALSQQEVPDYFAGPAVAKTVTQESRVVFGPEQAEWKEAILAELESFAKLGYMRLSRWEIRGKRKSLAVWCFRGDLTRCTPDEMTSSKTPSYPMLRMLLSLASYKGWPIETWDVSDGVSVCKAVWRSGHRLGWSIYLYETAKGDREARVTPGRDHLEVEEGIVWAADISVGMGGRARQFVGGTAVGDRRILVWSYSGKGNPCLWAVVQLPAEKGPTSKAGRQGVKSRRLAQLEYRQKAKINRWNCLEVW